ncbi:hypothetical protein NMG60_11012256 [Bertholletia excelsa]
MQAPLQNNFTNRDVANKDFATNVEGKMEDLANQSDEWFLDSGTTHHLTSSFENLSASAAYQGFLPEEWDNFFVKFLYPSFTPTVFFFVAGTVAYGVFKYLQNEKLKSEK